MIFIDRKTREERMSICKGCEHYNETTRSCGTLVLGDDLGELVSVKGKKRKVRLCGCVMPMKTKFKTASCPLKKWVSKVDADAIKDLQKLVEIADKYQRFSNEELKQFYKAYNQTFEAGKQLSSCSSCVKQMVQEAREALKNR
jgi:hypothetical protein